MFKLIVFGIVFSVFFVSCKKDDDTEVWVSAASDYAVAEAFIQEIFKIVDEAAKNEVEIYKLASLDCATITLVADTPGVFPKSLIIDFGLVNCIGTDGRKRRGVIKAEFNNNYSEPGTMVYLVTENFFINNYKVILNNVSITHTGNSVQMQHHINFPELRLINPSGQSIIVNGSRTFKMISGEGSQGADDDIFQVTGSFSGSTLSGSAITATITNPLILSYECRSISSGLLNVSLPDADGVFDYGNGDCDDKATVTIDSRPFFIMLE